MSWEGVGWWYTATTASMSGKANLPLFDKSLERTVLLIEILN